MKTNRLTIQINKPVNVIYSFTTTPPSSSKWIKGVVKEETNEWPIKVGTVYKLYDKDGHLMEAIVKNINENKSIEWISRDNNYHCRYTFNSISENSTEFIYEEWNDVGEIDGPFTQDYLEKLKEVIEGSNYGSS